MGIRDDYLLRFITLLRQAIADMLKLRKAGRYEAALHAAFAAQERLFSQPIAELSKLSLDQLLHQLRRDEPQEVAAEKAFGYASLLHETGRVYQEMGRDQLATGCFQLALHTLLLTALDAGSINDERRATLRELLALIPPDELHEPVREALKKMNALSP